MAFFVGCFFCIIIGCSTSNAAPMPSFPPIPLMEQDSTPPDSSRTVVVRELPSKRRSKQVRIKEKIAKTKKNKRSNKPTPKGTPAEQSSKEITDSPSTPVETPSTDVQAAPSTQVQAAPSTEIANNKKKKVSVNSPSLSAEEELRLLAQAPPTTLEQRTPVLSQEQCAFAFDHVDEFTGTRKKGLAPRLFFAYTPEQYRKFLKTSDFIHCEGYLSQSSEGGMALNLSLSIASPAAREKFGDLPPSSNLTLKTMQGKEFFLKTYKGAKAVVKGDVTVYEASFVISKADARQLATAEVDQVRLRFTEGFQIYEVYYLDFLREQFPCFKP